MNLQPGTSPVTTAPLLSQRAGRASPSERKPEQVVCLENIGPRERRKRIGFGVILLVASLGLAAVVVLTGVNRWWRLALFLPLAGSAIGFFQAFERT